MDDFQWWKRNGARFVRNAEETNCAAKYSEQQQPRYHRMTPCRVDTGDHATANGDHFTQYTKEEYEQFFHGTKE